VPKLLYFVTEDWYFRSHRLPLARAAIEAGFEVVLLTRVGAHRQEIESMGIRVIHLEMRRRSINPLREIATFRSIYSILKVESPDILHLVALKPIIYGGMAGLLAGFGRMVCAVAGLGYVFTSRELKAALIRPIMKMLLSILLARPNVRVIVQNPDDGELLVNSVGVEKVRTVLIRGAGVDPIMFSPPREEPRTIPVVLFASRMIWDKGVAEFVEAAQILRDSGVVARFVLAGGPDPGNPVSVPEAQLKEWNNTGAVEWWGPREDMPEVLSQSTLVCLPSAYGEGVPKILIEAAACGRAIIASDAPGCREIVRHGENGLLVPLKDAAALAEAMGRLLADPELCRRMGERGRDIAVREFSVSQVVGETMAIYRELLTT